MFPGRHSRDVQSKHSCALPHRLFFTHLGRNNQNLSVTPLQAVIMLLPAQIPIRQNTLNLPHFYNPVSFF